jgi:enamine deaminase RidA (YjgF/YER057c/UK114 family)
MKYKLALIAATVLLLCARGNAQNQPIEDELGYTHAIKTGNTLYISGTTSTGSMAAQVASIMDDIQGTLRHYGASLKNVVKETVYTTSLDSFMAVRSLHKSFYHGDYPASTWVEVKRLLLPQFLVEIEVTAVLPEQ